MIMMSQSLENLLTTFGPMLTVLIGFVTAGVAFLKHLYAIINASNINNVLDNIKKDNESLKAELEVIIDYAKSVAIENAELRKQNKEIKELITKVKEGD